jgi:hypothetical protein
MIWRCTHCRPRKAFAKPWSTPRQAEADVACWFYMQLLTSCRNREDPIGYKLSMVEFDGTGSPRAAANSTTAAVDIVSNTDLSACPRNCFRPVGLAWDAQGRLFMSSDSTGEIYIITKTDGSGINDVSRASSTTGGNGTPSGTAPSSSASTGSAIRRQISKSSYWVAGVVVASAATI